MKKYKVTVNGSVYEIELEEMKAGEKVAAEKPQSAPVASAPAGGEGEAVLSPMPGNILSINVKEGQSVKKGDVLMILEAMKMENEIMAPADGKVTSLAAKGSAVETGAVLCKII